MASHHQLMILVVVLLSYHFLPSATSRLTAVIRSKSESNLIESTCNKTLDYKTCCTKVLGSDPDTSSASNSVDLAKAAFKLAIEETANARDNFTNLLSQNSDRHELTKPIEKCISLFEIAIKDFNVSRLELVEGFKSEKKDSDFGAVQAGYCQRELARSRVKVPEVAIMNINKLKCFGRIAFALEDNLKAEYPVGLLPPTPTPSPR